MPTHLLVTGSAGQLGAEFVQLVSLQGYAVTALDRNALNIANPDQVLQRIAASKPDIIVNCAAYNQVDLAEKEPLAAFEVNALAVRSLALAAHESGARLVHLSTDYVFDGSASQPYSELDRTGPVSSYGVSKLAGELYAFAYVPALVVRVCGVFGPHGIATARGNFVETMLRAALAGKDLKVIADATVAPSYAPALADRILGLIERGATGIYHCAGPTAITWYDYARLIFDAYQLQPSLAPVPAANFPTPAKRPVYSVMSTDKMQRLGIAPLPPLAECLRDYAARRPLTPSA